ncbi:MAG: DUF1624 domain-containing protein [Planctomycetia bacterium]|nr:DUF1624 domain-containing protein [Planctomycetia bacterium]
MNHPPPLKPERLDSIDCLRGIIIVLMALDHTKDFWGASGFIAAENAVLATPAAFFTRWLTHFCAPTFVLLAGVGAFLSQSRGMSKKQLFLFLLTRGLWLVFLELTVVHFGWSLKWEIHRGMWQVIWAIGWSMVGLSLLIWLPAWCVGLLGCIIIGGHNYFDGLTGSKLVTQTPWLVYLFGENGWFWDLLHTPYRTFQPMKGYVYFSLYPLLPWFGVMCAGYGLGTIMKWVPTRRRWTLLILGMLFICLFLGLRYLNIYGDPSKWRVIPGGESPTNYLRTTMSFIACTKYPPSLLFLLMTLGPALLFLLLLEWPIPLFKRFFLTFGRVPLFFYLIHLPVIHGSADWYFQRQKSLGLSSKGFDLPDVYLVWGLIILLLYFPCLGFGWLKKRYGGILKYL